MIEPLLVAKIVVSIVSVVGLSIIAENVSPRVAGILSGYPLGTAIVLFFVGIENGVGFAASSSVYTLGGLSASLFLLYVYYRTIHVIPRTGAVFPSICSVLGFLCIAGSISQFSLSLIEGLVITVSAILFFCYTFRKIENIKIGKKIKLTFNVLLLRALAAALIVIFITGLAKSIGPEWSGILAAFPVTLFPLLLVIHLTYGRPEALTIIKNYPYGLGALVVYTISVSFTYPLYGVYYGTLLCFILATCYLVLYALVSNSIAARST